MRFLSLAMIRPFVGVPTLASAPTSGPPNACIILLRRVPGGGQSNCLWQPLEPPAPAQGVLGFAPFALSCSTSMSTRPLTAEEMSVIARARVGGSVRAHSSRRGCSVSSSVGGVEAHYPAGASVATLGLLGQIDALLKAEPRPPKWALLRVLSMLEEHSAR